MSPTDFEALALQWISVVVPVGIAGVTAYYKIKAYVDKLHAQNAGRIDIHDAESGISTKPDTSMKPITQDIPIVVDGELKSARITGEIGQLPDPQAFRQPLGQPTQK